MVHTTARSVLSGATRAISFVLLIVWFFGLPAAVIGIVSSVTHWQGVISERSTHWNAWLRVMLGVLPTVSAWPDWALNLLYFAIMLGLIAGNYWLSVMAEFERQLDLVEKDEVGEVRPTPSGTPVADSIAEDAAEAEPPLFNLVGLAVVGILKLIGMAWTSRRKKAATRAEEHAKAEGIRLENERREKAAARVRDFMRRETQTFAVAGIVGLAFSVANYAIPALWR